MIPYFLLCVAHGRQLVTSGHPIPVSLTPYMVRLYTEYLGNGFCGGTLINSVTVLTAAHCVYAMNKNDVFVGTHQTTTHARPLGPYSDIVPVGEIRMHALYNDSDVAMGYDMALLILERKPYHYDSSLSSVLIDDGTYWPAEGSPPLPAYILGYGADVYDGSQSVSLEMGPATLLSNSQCTSVFGSDLHSTNRCASGMGAASCSGDSGGPLIVVDKGEHIQVGIVSWGVGECGEYPTVYVPTQAILEFTREYQNTTFQSRGFVPTEEGDPCECTSLDTCKSNGVLTYPHCGCGEHFPGSTFCYVEEAGCVDSQISTIFLGAFYKTCTGTNTNLTLFAPTTDCDSIRDKYINSGCCEG